VASACGRKRDHNLALESIVTKTRGGAIFARPDREREVIYDLATPPSEL
jgi:hypothetical protein